MDPLSGALITIVGGKAQRVHNAKQPPDDTLLSWVCPLCSIRFESGDDGHLAWLRRRHRRLCR